MPLTFKCEYCSSTIYTMHLEIGESAKCKNCNNKTTIPADAKTISEFAIPEKDRIKTKKSKIVKNELKTNINENKHSEIVNKSKILNKYPALQIISSLLKFISILVFFISIFIFIKTLNDASSYNSDKVFILALPQLIFSIISAICIYGYGELITLFIDIEKNTRKSK